MDELEKSISIQVGGVYLNERGVRNALYFPAYLRLADMLGIKQPCTLARLLNDTKSTEVKALVDEVSAVEAAKNKNKEESYPSITI